MVILLIFKHKTFFHKESSFLNLSVLNELTLLGKQLYGALVICKKLKIYPCGHKGTKKARGCMKSLIEDGNKDHLFFATKDPNVSIFRR